MDVKEVSLILRVEGGVADEGLLDVYDAANTITGLARAVNLVAHAFANNEEVRTKNQSAKGAQAFIHSSKKGCFEEQVDIRFGEKIARKVGGTVLVNVFWDYLSWTLSSSVGVDYEPQTPYVKKIASKKEKELFIHEVADALESPMYLIHKAITSDENVKIFFNRPRVGDALALGSDTLDYVTVREVQADSEYIVGNVTKVNVLSHFGRLFSDEEGKVVSFALAHPDDHRLKGLSLKSMQEHNDGLPGKVHLRVRKVVSANGVVKRYIVEDILEVL
ncbi:MULTISPECIES: hypothetical protein [Pseudomonas syringae group]|uniref:DUF7946 domain-containing protein n=1 Tax=Pseudomonas syringae group TaxID=136849 RepID=UPI000A804F34|nr:MULTISPECIES: hypothetical protein [Pseudomonas syringae group]